MTTQPLTPANPHVVILGPDVRITDLLLKYGVPTDAGNVEPTLTVTRIRSVAEWTTFKGTAPSASLPWCASGWTLLADGQLLYDMLYAYFGAAKTPSECLSMQNNEYAIHPRLLRG